MERILGNAVGVEIIPKASVKIQKVKDFKSLLQSKVDLGKLRKGFMLGEVIIV